MRIFVWGCVAAGGLWVALGALSLLSPPCCSQKASNERNASAGLKTIASAQADYRDNDRDANKIRDFWRGDISGLYSVLPAGETDMIKLIELSVAGADAAPLGKGRLGDVGPGQIAPDQFAVGAPKAGYLYRALQHGNEDPQALDSRRFAACAYPAAYPSSGRWTYVISENGTIFRKDLGPGARLLLYPADPIAEGWRKLD